MYVQGLQEVIQSRATLATCNVLCVKPLGICCYVDLPLPTMDGGQIENLRNMLYIYILFCVSMLCVFQYILCVHVLVYVSVFVYVCSMDG